MNCKKGGEPTRKNVRGRSKGRWKEEAYECIKLAGSEGKLCGNEKKIDPGGKGAGFWRAGEKR